MSATPPHSPLHAPPLPRYRYHPKTGAWRKERVAEDAAGTGGGGAAAASSPVSGPVSSSTFESSYDFFLRSVRPPVQHLAAAEREERRRDATNAKLRQFEAGLLPRPATAVKGKMLSATTIEHRSTADSVGPSGVLHPLIGYASTVSLPAVYAALALVKDHPLSFAAATTAPENQLTRGDFHELLTHVGPAEVLSAAYADTMFASLPSYDVDSDTVSAPAVFTLVVEHRHHPRLNTNVAALFDAFDPDARGVVPAEVLAPDVLTAWAVQRTFGNLRDQWQRFAAVIERERGRAAAALPLLPPLASRAVVRAALCSVAGIYTAACSLDLDGSSL
ncbi:hypothetical protein NESM_000614400 [Novymonas esmeraldas]|uniref:EF-hand domain-containing protein n=1 Tax=Novymonas esmeraldas TaxID=1808958 RepID=A0AAW0ET95_9TRYP